MDQRIPRSRGGLAIGILLIAGIVLVIALVAGRVLEQYALNVASFVFLLLFLIVPPLLPKGGKGLAAPVAPATVGWLYASSLSLGLVAFLITIGTANAMAAIVAAAVLATVAIAYAIIGAVRPAHRDHE